MAACLLCLLTLAGPLSALADESSTPWPPPWLDEIREELDHQLNKSGFTAMLAGLINVTLSPDISSATYDPGGDGASRISTFKIPGAHTVDLGGRYGLILLGNLGYMKATNRLYADLEDPELDSHMDVKWEAYTVMGGTGLRIRLAPGLYVAPMVSLAYSYLRNSAQYENPHAQSLLDPLLRGLLVDWHVQSLTYSAALGVGYKGDLGPLDLDLRAIYTHAYTTSFDSTNSAQDIDEHTNTIASNATVRGPLGLSVGDHDLNWLGILGYTVFLGPESDSLGFSWIGEVGAGLELDTSAESAFLNRLGIKGTLLFGDDMTGLQVGLSLRF